MRVGDYMNIKVEFEVNTSRLHPGATKKEIQEWLEYCLGSSGRINRDNVLSPYDIECAKNVIFEKI